MTSSLNLEEQSGKKGYYGKTTEARPIAYGHYAIAALAGTVAVLGWAPFDAWPVALASYAVLFWLTRSTTPANAGVTGLAFGIGLHTAGHGWIFQALHAKSGLGLLPAGLSTAGVIIFLAAFTAIPCWIARRLDYPFEKSCRQAGDYPWWLSSLLYAGLMTLGEWARSFPLNGFTSLSLGYTLIDTWLSGYGPVAGLYGMSWLGFILAITASRLAVAPRTRVATVAVTMASMFCLFLSGKVLERLQWTKPEGQLSYRLIQANVAQEHKFDPRYIHQEVQRLVKLIEQAPADIIATPETAFPLFLHELPGETLQLIQESAIHMGSHIFAGIATEAANSDGYNSVLGIFPRQSNGEIARYNKVRLMPFGEYSPTGFEWFTRHLSIPLKDMSAGELDQFPFAVSVGEKSYGLGTLICHEDLIGQEARRWAYRSALLLNPSNLAWFEDSLAIEQRLQIVRMRALETGRPILRIANTGVTAHIDQHGDVIARLPVSKEGTLAGTVQPTQGLTPYAYLGDSLAILISLGGIALLVSRSLKRLPNKT